MYDYPPFRPPSEASSLLLRVTRGCPWNRCAFCSMYKSIPFQVRPTFEVFMDIETVRKAFGEGVMRVFIGDSDSLVAGEEVMVEVLDHLRYNFPNLRRVTTYARARTLCRRPVESLKRIHQAGLTRLHVGLESGHAATLREIQKGATPRQMIEGCLRAKEAGYEVSLYVLLGIAGQEDWRAHAEATAEVLNEIAPHFVRVRTYVPTPDSPLFDRVRGGGFHLASVETILAEQRLIVERLECPTYYLSDHVSNYLSVEGMIPQDRERMLMLIDEGISRLNGDPRYKASLERMRYLNTL